LTNVTFSHLFISQLNEFKVSYMAADFHEL